MAWMIAMKNGKKIVIYTLAFSIGVAIARAASSREIDLKNVSPTINQYLNRLREFFDDGNLDMAEDEFLSLVDFGISPESAFASVAGMI